MPPMRDALVAIKANRKDLLAAPRQSAISNGSGGMGKKELSVNEITARTYSEYLLLASSRHFWVSFFNTLIHHI